MTTKELEILCHKRSLDAGWYKDPKTGKDIPVTPELIGLKLALIHSEISEALEGIRKNLMDDKLPHRKMGEVELADAIIRIFDLSGLMCYNVTQAIYEKMEYNLHREDHKLEHRAKEGGKQF